MRIIFLLVFIGFAAVSGIAGLANFVEVAGPQIGIFYYPFFQQEIVPEAVQDEPAPETLEGCPVSFWAISKNPDDVDFNSEHWPPGYLPDDLYGDPAYFNKLITTSLGENPTLHDALQSEGDGINKLARHSVAALLNSAHTEINYPLPISEIISKTQQSIDSEEYSFADELEINNNLGEWALCG